MAEQRYEHRVIMRTPVGDVEKDPTQDPAEAGIEARRLVELAAKCGGGTVEIQRRPVGEWETVERREVAAEGGG